MWRRFELLRAFSPAAGLLLFAGWAGTFAGAARDVAPLVGHGALLLCLVGAGFPLHDPLALGRRGSLLLAALLTAIFVSWHLSPVPRAGHLALLLLPAFLFVPRAVAICWATAERRRMGVLAVSAVAGAVAAWSLFSWRLAGGPASGGPAALPLGHHNLLAAFLVTLLPIAVLPWWDGGLRRGVATLSGGFCLAALLGTRSLSAALAAALLAAVTAVRTRRGGIAVAIAALLLLPQLPRLAGMATFDSSLHARLGYLAAGGRGVLERPIFGRGPGATAWTASEKMRPVPGVHPPGEAVADLHSLPLQLAYELGIPGVLLTLGVALVFWRRRRAEARDATGDFGLRQAAGLGVAAFAVMSLAGMPLAVTALPVVLAVVLGAWWAACGGPRRALPATGRRWPALVLAVALALAAAPLHLARRAYERAIYEEDPDAQVRHLRRAVELDPAFPLYRARLAWLERELGDGPDRELARRARGAAGDAWGVAPLWLVAGILGQEAGETWSAEALIRACRLDPLGALAPYFLAVGEGPHPLAPEWGARALLADPDLLAAAGWDGRGELLAGAVEWAAESEGVDPGWRLRLRQIFEHDLERSGEIRRRGLVMDRDDDTSLSLHLFRRAPWPVELAAVDVDLGALERIDLVPAVRLATTAPGVLAWRNYCALGE